MYQFAVVRHGESEWNALNLFTGWKDVSLSPKGKQEALEAGESLQEAGFKPDIVFISELKRSQETWMNINLKLKSEPVIEQSWKINERNYGALQGLNKQETAEKYGEDKVKLWRRSWDVRPPLMDLTDARIKENSNEKDYPEESIHSQRGESLKDTYNRTVPYFIEKIQPLVLANNKILIVAHGNSLRSVCKYLENIPDQYIAELEIPTGKTLLYTVDANFKFIKKEYL